MAQLKLGTIEEERAACEAAFKGVPEGWLVLHAYHEGGLLFLLAQTYNFRIHQIAHKPLEQQALRYRLMRPVKMSWLSEELRQAWVRLRQAESDLKIAAAKAQQEEIDLASAEWKSWQMCKTFFDIRTKWQNSKEAAAFHSAHCIEGCPWDGKTFLPGVE